MVFCLAIKGVSMLVQRRVRAVKTIACFILLASFQLVAAEEGSDAVEFSAPETRGDSGSFENPADENNTPLPVSNRSDANVKDTAGNESETPAADEVDADGETPETAAPPSEDAPAVQGPPMEGGPIAPADGETADNEKPKEEGEKKADDNAVEFTDKPAEQLAPPPPTEFQNLDPHGVLEGYVGWKNHNRAPKEAIENESILPVPDRWRLGMHPNTLRARGNLWNPYRQNMLKGDYPIIGQSIFMAVIASSDTLIEGRSVPTPSNVSTARPNSEEFFGRPDQLIFNQNFLISVELFKGETDFKPREWEFRLTPVFNFNYVDVEENFVLNIDPRRGSERLDHQIAFQELFGEYHFRDISPSYDFLSSRTGIQLYNNDFRGFNYSDFEPGVRIFGQYEANRLQYNFAFFEMLEKDTNSGLNTTFQFRDEHVLMANLVRQDTFWKGYNALFNLAFSAEESTVEYNENGVIVRPSPVGSLQPHNIKSGYLGWGGDGHIGRLNISHQFYQVFGHDDNNGLAGRETDINAQMFALELSYDHDWMRFRTSLFYASGDDDPLDGEATGFDAIFDNPNFAGGQFSYWVRQGFGAGNALTSLKSRFSLLPNLSTSKEQGQSNFVNPGVEILNFGYDADLTPRLRATLNYNYIQFNNTSSLETLLQQNGIDRKLGHDYGIGLIYRPWLNQQVILTGGLAGFTPMQGFRDVYEANETLYSGFLNVIVRY